MNIKQQCEEILSEAQRESDRIKKSIKEFHSENKGNPKIGSIHSEFYETLNGFKIKYYPQLGISKNSKEFLGLYEDCNKELKLIYDELFRHLNTSYGEGFH